MFMQHFNKITEIRSYPWSITCFVCILSSSRLLDAECSHSFPPGLGNVQDWGASVGVQTGARLLIPPSWGWAGRAARWGEEEEWTSVQRGMERRPACNTTPLLQPISFHVFTAACLSHACLSNSVQGLLRNFGNQSCVSSGILLCIACCLLYNELMNYFRHHSDVSAFQDKQISRPTYDQRIHLFIQI